MIDALSEATLAHVRRGLLRLGADAEDVDDAVQDGCVKALETWPVRGIPTDARAWLFIVSRNCLRDIQRARGRRQLVEVPLYAAEADDDPPM